MTLSRRQAMAAFATAAAVPVVAGRAYAGSGGVVKAGPAELEEGTASGFYRFKVGAIEAVALTDGTLRIAPIHPVMAPEATLEELNKALTHAFHPLDVATPDISVLCLKVGKETVLIDTGTGPKGKLMGNMKAAGIDPASVTAIVLSHAHGDHIAGGLNAEGGEAFPNARWIVNKVEHDFWTASTRDMKDFAFGADAAKGAAATAQKVFGVIGKKMELVKGGDKLIDGLELVDTPGHTPGHMSVMISDGDQQVMAMGDLAHNHVVMFANPAWTIGFDVDKKAAVAMREKTFDRLAADRVRVFGYHMPWPGLAHIRKNAAGFEWVIEPWAW